MCHIFVDEGLWGRKKSAIVRQVVGAVCVVWWNQKYNDSVEMRGNRNIKSHVLNAADKTGRHKSNGDADESQGWGILGQDKGPNGKRKPKKKRKR
jgi:hypothetical protein